MGAEARQNGRYPADVRWTGKLQTLLGDRYDIIEEGLGSRTTDLDYSRKPGRNGKTYLVPCLGSHTPLDIVVLMLGTNDLKIEYSRSADDIARAISGLVGDVRQYTQDSAGNVPKIVLVSPILIDEQAPRFYEFYTGYYDEKATHESHKLAAAILEVAEQQGCEFIDAASVAKPGEDGLHLSEESQAPLAELLKNTIQSTGI